MITDPSVQSAIDALSVPGIMIGYRLISAGDEDALLPDEAAPLAASIVKVRRASGAARIVARDLLARLGYAGCALPKAASGAPIWPAGIVGSLAHDARVAIAAVGRSRDVEAVGIDVEPAEPLPAEILDMVATPQELLKIADDPCQGRLLFVAKEAVYKAVYSARPDVSRPSRRRDQPPRSQGHRVQWPGGRAALRHLDPPDGAGLPPARLLRAGLGTALPDQSKRPVITSASAVS